MDELDDAIRDLQTLAALAEDRGDIAGAMELSKRRMAAIRSRTPEHAARIDQEERQRIDEGLDYFAHQGALAREMLRRTATHFDVDPAAVRRRMT
jgi:hypothetical protein